MNNTKSILLGLVVLALLASCKKNNNNTAEGFSFKAVIEHNSDGNRTYLDGDLSVDGWDNQVKWMEGDVIRVVNAAGDDLVFEITEGDSTMYGTFYNGGDHETFFQPDYTALYPSTNADGVSNTIDEDGIATFTLPATQTITVTGTFANKAMPMVAHSSTQTLEFKNVLGGLVIPLVGDGLPVTSVVLTSLNSSDKLWGTYTADCNSDNPVPTYYGGGDHQLTLSCDVTLDAATPEYFVFMVPPGTLESGFTVGVYYGSSLLYERTADWSASPVQGFIPRSTLRTVSSNLEIEMVNPVVTTISPTFISTNSALGIGSINDYSSVTEFGVCWALASVTNMPTIDNNLSSTIRVQNGNKYDLYINGLDLDEVYFVRAYAKNVLGEVIYGDPIPFATRKDYFSSTYNGRMPGLFTITAEGNQVYFAAGNLQYTTTGEHAVNTNPITMEPGTWRIAGYQFEYVGDATQGMVYANGMHPDASLNGTRSNNALIGPDYTGWIDLYGWATSGYNCGSPNYLPYETEGTGRYYGPEWNHLTNTYANCDWGVYNAISNGGDTPNLWRTLQHSVNGSYNGIDEWTYVFTGRSCPYRYVHVGIGGIRASSEVEGNLISGIILFPDDFAWPTTYLDVLANINATVNPNTNRINEAQWSLLEKAGAVFMPACGSRNTNGTIQNVGTTGSYRTSSLVNNGMSWNLVIGMNVLNLNSAYDTKASGLAVRLVQDAN